MLQYAVLYCSRARLLLAALLVSVNLPLYAVTLVELNEDDSIIVEMRLGNQMLTDAMIVYASTDYTLVSFQEFLDGIEFAITVDSEREVASGWFVNPANTFQLDVGKNEVYIKGKKQELGDNFRYYADSFDMYVDVESLREWFNLKISLQMARLLMRVESDTPLPVQQRLLRDKARDKKKTTKARGKEHPWVEDEYLWLGPPAIDFRATGIYSDLDGSSHSYSMLAAGDLLKHESRISHNYLSNDDSSNTRLTFSRKAPRPNKTMVFGMTEYNFGDVYVQGDRLISTGGSGVGFSSRREFAQSLDQSFNRRDFEGDAPPGWEVELYRNGLFIDFQLADDSGKYLFTDVEIQYGENFFEIRIYGPQGQQRIEKRRIQVGGDMIVPGQWQYAASYLRENEQLIGEPNLTRANSEEESYEYTSLAAYYGLLHQHSIGLGYAQTPPSSKTDAQKFGRLIWLSAYPKVSTRVETATDFESGSAVSLDMAGRLFKQDMSFEYQQFKQFYTQQSNFGNLKNNAKFVMFGNFPVFGSRNMMYSLAYSQSETIDALKRYTVENRLGLSLGRMRFSNELASRGDNENGNLGTRGTFTFNHATAWYQFRASTNYTLEPEEFTSVSMTTDFRRKSWRLQLSGNTQLQGEKTKSAGINISRVYKNAALSLAATTDFENGYIASLNFEFGLASQTQSPYLSTTRYGASGGGRVQGRVFLDKNGDGVFNEDDEPMQNIGFKGRSDWAESKTNDEGRVVLSGIDTNIGSVVHLDTVSLDDPYLHPMKPTFRVVSHSGGYRKVDIPITQITEVEGFVNLIKGDESKPVGGVTVALLAGDKVIAKSTTEFDGYYSFPRVPPGKYYASVIDEDSVMDKYRWEPSEIFETDMESGVTVVPDIELFFKDE